MKSVLNICLISILLMYLSACNPNSSVVGSWINAEQAIAIKFYKTGDVNIFSPCYPNEVSGAGVFEFVDSNRFKVQIGDYTKIFGFQMQSGELSLQTDILDEHLSGTYFTEQSYIETVYDDLAIKDSEEAYWYTTRKVGENYEYIGVPDDKGWTGFNLGEGSIKDKFHGCVGGLPLFAGQFIFDQSDRFYKDSYTQVLQSNADESMYFLKKKDIDYGTLSFRFFIDGFDNKKSLQKQTDFFQKNGKGCRYSYGTPIMFKGERSTKLFVPRRCGSTLDSFIYANVYAKEGKLISTRMKLINLPQFGRYLETDCSPSSYITDVGEKTLNVRLVLTTEYGQNFNSKADGQCSPRVKEMVKDIVVDLP